MYKAQNLNQTVSTVEQHTCAKRISSYIRRRVQLTNSIRGLRFNITFIAEGTLLSTFLTV